MPRFVAGAGGFFLLALGLASSGCQGSNTTRCGELICPADSVCSETLGRCVNPDQLAPCVDKSDGDSCVFSDANGVCRDGLCVLLGCGDGVVTAPEECEGDQLGGKDCTAFGYYVADGLSCASSCTFDLSGCGGGRCGDGALNGTEACDGDQLDGKSCLDYGFYQAAGLACTGACTPDVSGCTGFCGDGTANGVEECDGADLGSADDCTGLGYYVAGSLGCSASCRYDVSGCGEHCGDGVVNGTEQCDGDVDPLTCADFGFYDQTTGLACSTACTFDTSGCDQSCGDGEINGTEDCDGAVPEGIDCTTLGYYFSEGLGCNGICGFDDAGCEGFCGDRILDDAWGEACDGEAPAGDCRSYGFESGSLGCSLCSPDFSRCAGNRWTPMSSGTTRLLRAVWGSAIDDVFAVGDHGTVLHYDGANWSPMVSGTLEDLHSVWGTGPDDVFAVGFYGTIIHYDGGSWSPMASGTLLPLNGVWASGPADVFAVGSSGTILHYDGAWSPMTSGTEENLWSVWGSGPNDVYVGGDLTNEILHYDGSWSTMTTDTDQPLHGIWGSGPNDVYAISSYDVQYYDGSVWTSSNCDHVLGITGSRYSDIFAVGASGRIRHSDGITWSSMASGTNASLYGVWANPGEVRGVFAVGSGGTILFWGNPTWSPMRPRNQDYGPFDVWASGDDVFVLIGWDGDVVHFDGADWSVISGSPITEVGGIWGLGLDEYFVVGDSGLIRRYGAVVSEWTVGSEFLNAVWGSGSDDIFAVGDNATILHYDGSWAPMTSPAAGSLGAVWGSGPEDVVAVGQSGTIIHYDGSTWSAMSSGTTHALQSVWGSGPRDYFAVGTEGTILHYDGVSWSEMTSGTSNTLREVHGTGPADVYAVGDLGTIIHFDGRAWSSMPSAETSAETSAYLAGLWAGDQVYAVARDPLLLRRLRSCRAESCGNQTDDDCDGYIDCADSDCAADAYCTGGGLCASATAIDCDDVVPGTTGSGAAAIDRYACDSSIRSGREVAYRLATSAAEREVTVTLTGATRDVDVLVLGATDSGACNPVNPDCLASSANTLLADETATFTARSNQTYFIVVDSYSYRTAGYTLSVTCP